jgi:hypothetical protein
MEHVQLFDLRAMVCLPLLLCSGDSPAHDGNSNNNDSGGSLAECITVSYSLSR